MCSTVVRRSYFTLRSPDISSTHPTLYTLITLLTVVPVLYFTPHHYLVTVNLFFLSLHLFWLLDGLRGLKASVLSQATSEDALTPGSQCLSTSKFWRVVRLGGWEQGCCSRCSLWDFWQEDDSVEYNETLSGEQATQGLAALQAGRA